MQQSRILSILVDEWFLIPECCLSLGIVNSFALKHLNPVAQTFVSQPGFIPPVIK
jgi:hypothetical protein